MLHRILKKQRSMLQDFGGGARPAELRPHSAGSRQQKHSTLSQDKVFILVSSQIFFFNLLSYFLHMEEEEELFQEHTAHMY